MPPIMHLIMACNQFQHIERNFVDGRRRPDGVPCEYETICESCPCFSTTVEFLPVLQKQKQDAEEKGQIQRVDVFAKLIKSME